MSGKPGLFVMSGFPVGFGPLGTRNRHWFDFCNQQVEAQMSGLSGFRKGRHILGKCAPPLLQGNCSQCVDLMGLE